VLSVLPFGAATAVTVDSSQAAVTAQPAGVVNWSMWRQNVAHSGVTPEGTLNATDPNLRLHWTAHLGAKAFSSPAVVYSQALGKSLVYVGDQAGKMQAFDAATGQLVWSFQVPKTPGLSVEIEASPSVSHSVVYFGAGDYHEYALNANTGALLCRSSFSAGGIIASSATVADPTGAAGAAGDVVYFGDSGPSGSLSDGGHLWAMNGARSSAGGCTLKWSYDAFGNPPGSQTGLSGVYSTAAYGQLPNGTPVVAVGTTDPDDSIYAFNALTGTRLWRFQTAGGIDADVGAPATITAPGVNGFADGMVYDTDKDGILYALDLVTGAQVWSFETSTVGRKNPAQSGTTVVGNELYQSFGSGEFSVNAVTGQVNPAFHPPAGTAVVSSPSVSGGAGHQVMFVGDLAGTIHEYSLATGAQLFSYSSGTSGEMFFSSAAISTGQVFMSSTTGALYALGL
jgi:outer membrane protein assembly factor BamB